MASKEKEADAEGAGETTEATGEAAPQKGFGKILGMLKSKKMLMIGAVNQASSPRLNSFRMKKLSGITTTK